MLTVCYRLLPGQHRAVILLQLRLEHVRRHYRAIQLRELPVGQHECSGPVNVHVLRGLLQYRHGLHARVHGLRCGQLQGHCGQRGVHPVCSGLLHADPHGAYVLHHLQHRHVGCFRRI